MTTKFLPDGDINKIDITDLVCKLQTTIPKNTISGNATCRQANFTKSQRFVILQNDPWNAN